MPTFGQQFAQGFTDVNALRDYTHASKVFTPNSFELKPRYKFLFHVSFTINNEIPGLTNVIGATQLSYVVKTVDLPKYSIANETLNQYNRKRVVQTKINYDPVTLVFHDDGGDNVRKMWYSYYNYYYKDASQQYLAPSATNGSLGDSANKVTGFGYNARDIYNNQRIGDVNDWGYIGEAYNDGTSSASGKPAFFRDIQITGFDQHKTATYVLINPLITNWAHDQYAYSEGSGIMQNTMTIAYETVKYYEGAVGKVRPDQNVHGFADPSHYDQTLSPISRPGSRANFMGQGGLLDAAGGIIEDLTSGGPLGLIGAAQKAGTAYNTFKGKDIKSIAINETVKLGVGVVNGAIPAAMRQIPGRASGMYYPTPKDPPTN
jgi:hypothetical protein